MAYSTSSGAVIRMGVDGAEESRRQIETVTASMNRLSGTVSTAFKALSSTIGIGSGLAGIIEMSDSYAKFTGQLRLAAQSNSEYVASLNAVKRISKDSQQDLAAVGTLYARISNGTRELGISQQRVADITDAVSLSLKVSGATAEESASAQLQLSQAFASGTLRGEEFNAVNEASPRLMKALADGIGVPIGALKDMASNGQITSQVMAEVLPKALGTLREEATKVQTIGGAFTVLKNNVLEFTAVQAQSNGTVAILTQGIGLLADNLSVVTGAATTFTAVKLITWLQSSTVRAYESATANAALAASSVATARANVEATAAASALAAARVQELRAAVMAAEGNVALAITTNGLIPAQANAVVAEAAHTAALGALTTATGAASVGARLLNGALGLLGGPLGAVVTLLGVAATAWSWYGSKAEESNREAAGAVETSTADILINLEKQNAKLRERLVLSKQPNLGGASADNSPETERAAALLRQINELKAQGNRISVLDQIQLISITGLYEKLAGEIGRGISLKAELAATGPTAQALIAVRERLMGVDKQYLEDLKALQAARESGAVNEKEYISLVGTLATETYKKSAAGKANASALKTEQTEYKSLMTAISEKIAGNKLEALGYSQLTDAQKMTIKLDAEIASGKTNLSAKEIAAARARIELVRVGDAELLSAKNVKQALQELRDQRQSEFAAAAAEVTANELSAKTFGLTRAQIEDLTVARLEDRLAQRKALDLSEEDVATTERLLILKRRSASSLRETDAAGYIKELTDANKRFAADSIFDEQQRAAAMLGIDAEVWQKRIELAGEGTEKQRALQEQFDIWYANQANKPMLDQWRESIKKYDDIFRNGFADMLNNGKSGWASFTKSLTTTFKTSVADQIYKMFAQPFVMKLVASLLGVSTATASGVANAAANAGGSSLGGSLGIAGTLGSVGAGALQTSAALLSGEIGFGSTLSAGFSAIASGTTSGLMAGFSSVVGALGPIALGIGAAVAIWKKLDTSGTYHTGGAASASAAGVSTIRAESLNFQGTRTSADTEKFVAGLASGIVSILDTTALAFGKTAGYTAATAFADDTSKDGAWGGLVIEKLGSKIVDWQDTRTSRWAPKEFADGAAGQAEYLAALSGSVRTALDGIGLPSWAATMLNSLGDAPSIETLTSTVSTIVAAQKALALMGEKLVGFAGMSDAATTALISASGSIDTLAANASSYYDNFYTEGEKAAATTKNVANALAAVGVAMPATREAYRAQLEAQLALGESGAKAAAVLLGMNAAFASVTAATEQATAAATSAADILREHQDLQSKFDELTMTTAQLAAKARSAIAPYNLALYDQVVAAQAAADSIADAKSALTDAYNSERDSIKATISTVKDYAATLTSFRNSMLTGDLSPLTPQQKYEEAKKQYEVTRTAAASGDTTAQGNLQGAITTFLTASRTVNASNDQYRSDFALTQSDLALAISGSKTQVSAAVASLAALEKQVSGQVTLNSSVLTVTAAIKQLGTLLGRDLSTTSQSSAISDLYQSLLGRAADSDGLQYWSKAMGNGASISQVADSISKSAEYLGNYPAGAKVQSFAAPPPMLDTSQYGASNTTALVAKVKELLASNEELTAEIKGLRADQQRQTGDQIRSNIDATRDSANTIADSVQRVVERQAYAERTKATLV